MKFSSYGKGGPQAWNFGHMVRGDHRDEILVTWLGGTTAIKFCFLVTPNHKAIIALCSCDTKSWGYILAFLWHQMLPCDQNLMPVVPPWHVTKISCLWPPLRRNEDDWRNVTLQSTTRCYCDNSMVLFWWYSIIIRSSQKARACAFERN